MASEQAARQPEPENYPRGGGPPQAPPAGPDRSRRRRPLIIGAIAIVLVGAVVAGVLYYLHTRGRESTDDAFVEGYVVPISPKVSGIVLKVAVDDNQDVPAGQLLAQIDPRDYQSRLDQAQAALTAAQARQREAQANLSLVQVQSRSALASAQAGVEQAEAGLKVAQAQAASATAEVAAAQAEATRSEADLKRYLQLEAQFVTPQQLDAARAAASTAAARLNASQRQATASESQIAEAQSKIAQAQAAVESARTGEQQMAVAQAQAHSAEAQVKQAEATLRQAQLDLSYTSVRAPVAGRVSRRSVEAGQYVQVGQPLLALVQPQMWVIANFKETQLTDMERGQDVAITVDAYPGRVFHGAVDSIQAGTGARFSLLPPENATGNYVKVVQRVPVKIVFDRDTEARLLLAPGMSVVPTVTVGTGGQRHPLPISPPPANAQAAEPTPYELGLRPSPASQPAESRVEP